MWEFGESLVVVHSYGHKLNISRFPKHVEMTLLGSAIHFQLRYT